MTTMIANGACSLDGRPLSEQERESLRLLGIYTAGRFNLYALAGNAKAGCRAHVMSAWHGRRMPQSKSGITTLRELFAAMAGVRGECIAECDAEFSAWARGLYRDAG